MQSPRSPQPPGSPKRNCFCGCLASPCRDNKYCSELCAREDTENMLMGKPSHYRNISQAEILGRLVQSGPPCRVAKRILVEADIVGDSDCEQRDESKPLPPLPPPPQPLTSRALADITNTLGSFKPEGALVPRQKRLHSSVLARRAGQRVV